MWGAFGWAKLSLFFTCVQTASFFTESTSQQDAAFQHSRLWASGPLLYSLLGESYHTRFIYLFIYFGGMSRHFSSSGWQRAGEGGRGSRRTHPNWSDINPHAPMKGEQLHKLPSMSFNSCQKRIPQIQLRYQLKRHLRCNVRKTVTNRLLWWTEVRTVCFRPWDMLCPNFCLTASLCMAHRTPTNGSVMWKEGGMATPYPATCRGECCSYSLLTISPDSVGSQVRRMLLSVHHCLGEMIPECSPSQKVLSFSGPCL